MIEVWSNVQEENEAIRNANIITRMSGGCFTCEVCGLYDSGTFWFGFGDEWKFCDICETEQVSRFDSLSEAVLL